ncbi:MAG: Rne/Rng family ribonuclease, partial [bacterium]|nr:Rne/Rng family ribonuclease [bacterium]
YKKPPLRNMKVELKEGQEIYVQISKEPLGTKGARVTTEIALPGRFLVLVPNANYIGVSKRVESFREKKRLKKMGREITPKNFGMIIRTVAQGKDEKILIKDFESLLKAWKAIETASSRKKAPVLLYKDMAMASSIIRDIFTNDIERVVVDNKKLLRRINGYLKDAAPQLLDKVEYYSQQKPIFQEFKIETDIKNILNPKIWLSAGGHIIINQTEAMVTIDVNSGKYIGGKDYELNATKVDMQAAKELARQLRLRDIGGLIVIDFIDVVEEKNRKKIYFELKNELKKDRAKTSILPMSDYGLIEMTRQRIRPSLLHTYSDLCPHCDGVGRILSKESIVSNIESWIKRYKMARKDKRLILQINPDIEEFLTDGWKSHLYKLMWKYWLKIDVEQAKNLKHEEFRFLTKNDKKDITNEFII